jgi:hypothetical protein
MRFDRRPPNSASREAEDDEGGTGEPLPSELQAEPFFQPMTVWTPPPASG